MDSPHTQRLAATVRTVASRAARRALIASAWRGASVALAAGGVLSLAWMGLSRVWPIAVQGSWMLWAPSAVGISVAVGAAVWKRWSIERAAREVDAKLRLRDALSSALALSARQTSGVEHELARLAIADADALASQANLVVAVPMPRARQWAGWAAAGVVAILAAWGMGEQWPAATPVRVTALATREQTKGAQSVVAQAKAALQEVAARSENAAGGSLDGRTDAMSQVERELAAGKITPRDAAISAAEELQATAEKLEKEANERERSSDEVQDALRALRERAANARAAPRQSELAKAIASGDAARAAEEISKLQDRLADLPADEREKVARELESLAEQSEQSTRSGAQSGQRTTGEGASDVERNAAADSNDLAEAMKQAADEIRRGESGESGEQAPQDKQRESASPATSPRSAGAATKPQPPAEKSTGESDTKPRPSESKNAGNSGEKSSGQSGSKNDAAENPQAPAGEKQPEGEKRPQGEKQANGKPSESTGGSDGKKEQSPVTPPGVETPAPSAATGEKQSGQNGQPQQGNAPQDGGKQGPQGQEKQAQSPSDAKGKAQSGDGQSQKDAQKPAGGSDAAQQQTRENGKQSSGEKSPAAEQKDNESAKGDGKDGQAGGEAGKDSSTPRKPDGSRTAPQPGGKEGAGAKEKSAQRGEDGGNAKDGGQNSSGGAGQGEQTKTPGMEELRRAMKNASEGRKSAAQSREQAERLREQAKRTLEQLKPEERAELQRLAQEMKKSPASGSQGAIPNDAPGQAPGTQAGALPGSGPNSHAMTAAGGDDDVVRVRGGDEGASKRTLAEWLAKPTKGEARGDASLADALQEVAAGAERAVEQQAVPSRHADYLKRVYKRYRERAAQTPASEKKP